MKQNAPAMPSDPATPATPASLQAGGARPVALVTGASSGIGLALAEEFARDGHDLVLVARSVDRLHALADTLRARHGASVHVIGADLADAGAAAALVEEVHRRGLRIAALANNAGVGDFGPFAEAGLDTLLKMMRLNMESVVALTHGLMPDLLAARGRILNTASTAAFQPGPWMAVYYATKAFVLSWSEALAEELSGRGVTVTALCPGPTASGFQAQAAMETSALVRGKRLPTAAEVAGVGYRALQRRRRVVVAGCLNALMALSVRFTPRRVVTAMVSWMSRPVGA